MLQILQFLDPPPFQGEIWEIIKLSVKITPPSKWKYPGFISLSPTPQFYDYKPSFLNLLFKKNPKTQQKPQECRLQNWKNISLVRLKLGLNYVFAKIVTTVFLHLK